MSTINKKDILKHEMASISNSHSNFVDIDSTNYTTTKKSPPMDLQRLIEKRTRVQSQLAKEFLAELLGIFLLMTFGMASVAQLKFSSEDNPYQASPLSVNISFGFGVALAILVTGKASGCHINPAVSLAMLLTGRLNWKRFFVYVIAQILGAFIASAVVFVVYLDRLQIYKPGMYSLDSAGIFSTYPSPSLTPLGGFFDQLVSTSLLIVIVLAVADKRNVEMPHGTVAILMGVTVISIGTSFAYNCGYAINPARDFGPRLFTWVAGWGPQVFTANDYFFWVPIVGPLFGSVIGTFVYLIFISNHL